MKTEAVVQPYLVAGLGITGKSVLSYLQYIGQPCLAYDTRQNFDLTDYQKNYPSIPFAVGDLPAGWIDQFQTIILSPGIALAEPWVQTLIAKGKKVIGDIELFATENERLGAKPVVAITGSNGKSTVATLVAEVLNESGLKVGLGGNIGKAALSLLEEKLDYDVFVLELSSFQLETTQSLKPISATVLNISEDHMDRYDSIEAYQQTKARIFLNADYAVQPLELQNSDFLPTSEVAFPKGEGVFSSQKIDSQGGFDCFDVQNLQGEAVLMQNNQPVLSVSKMAQQGQHHLLNALAVIGLCKPFKVAAEDYEKVFARFTGLAHRTQLVADIAGVKWVNDSKGTNVGATVTAIESFAPQVQQTQGQLWLIAGGVSKDADFADLATAMTEYQVKTVLFGRDANQIAGNLPSGFELVETLEQAVTGISKQVRQGDLVLFSPACASFDQFKNYVHRGEVFEALVKQLEASNESNS